MTLKNNKSLSFVNQLRIGIPGWFEKAHKNIHCAPHQTMCTEVDSPRLIYHPKRTNQVTNSLPAVVFLALYLHEYDPWLSGNGNLPAIVPQHPICSHMFESRHWLKKIGHLQMVGLHEPVGCHVLPCPGSCPMVHSLRVWRGKELFTVLQKNIQVLVSVFAYNR